MVSASTGERMRLAAPCAAAVHAGPVVIEPAKTTEDLMATFKGRHDVFVGEHIIGTSKHGLVFDEFDAVPHSQNFVAKRGDEVVGGCRATIGSSSGLPCDRYFDFTAFFAATAPGECSTGSFLWVKSQDRRSTIGLRLVRKCMEWGRERGVRHVGAAIRPEATPIFVRHGWLAIAPQFDHPLERAPVVPMVADLLHDRS